MTIRVRKWLVLTAGLAATTPAAATVAPAAYASTTNQPQTAASISGPGAAEQQPGTPRIARRLTAAPAGADCATVREKLRRHELTGDRFACTTLTTAPQHTTGSAAPHAQHAAATAWCTGLAANDWWVTRTSGCVHETFSYTVVDKNGIPLGQAQFQATQEIDTETTSITFAESDTLTLVSEEGAAAGITASWTTTCPATCSPGSEAAWQGALPMAPGETLEGHVSFTDDPAPGPDPLTLNYTITLNQPDGVVVVPGLGNSPTIRCDSLVGKFAGCVMPEFTPTLQLSRATSGASADMVSWAQHNLADHWGLEGSGQPLHRLADDAAATANRSVICPSSFPKDPAITSDSCDEFPFAKSKESGASAHVTGDQCAQVTAVRDPNSKSTDPLAVQWPAIQVTRSTGAEHCVRGHIPLPLNSDAGGALGNFTTNARLLDNDPYWIAVTS